MSTFTWRRTGGEVSDEARAGLIRTAGASADEFVENVAPAPAADAVVEAAVAVDAPAPVADVAIDAPPPAPVCYCRKSTGGEISPDALQNFLARGVALEEFDPVYAPPPAPASKAAPSPTEESNDHPTSRRRFGR